MEDWENWEVEPDSETGKGDETETEEVKSKEVRSPRPDAFLNRGRGFSPLSTASSSSRYDSPWTPKNDNGRSSDDWPQRRDNGRSSDDWPQRRDNGRSSDDWPQRRDDGRSNDDWPQRRDDGRSNDDWPQRRGSGRGHDDWPQRNRNERGNDDWPQRNRNGGRNENWSQRNRSGGRNENWSQKNRSGGSSDEGFQRSRSDRSYDDRSSDWDSASSPRDKKDNWRFYSSGSDKRDESGPPKPRSTYVPAPPTEDVDEIFGNAISSGINFSKYDDIEVKVSGANPPRPISCFEEAELPRTLTDLIKRCKYSRPTPIQKYAIPIIMSGRDMMACAQTGSGKTAAYLIPIISKLLEVSRARGFSTVVKPQAIIISPTRELAIQIFDEARKFSYETVLRVAITYGGTAVQHQLNRIRQGCDILVATPGRLIDFLKRGSISLTDIRFLVLDEADRMLDMGFLPDMEALLSHSTMVCADDRQTMMFSATFPDEIQRLAGQFLNDYLFVAVGIVGGACSDVEQRFFCVSKFDKRNKLMELLEEMGSNKTLVFVEQKRTTDFIATFLCEKDFPATSIHGDREQKEREEALKDFKQGRMDILVATSVAARGLDIKDVAHVVNFDLPSSIDEYVHRIGRTGRVGNRGLATSFYDPEKDRALAADLIKILAQAQQQVPNFLLSECPNPGVSGPSQFGGSDFRRFNRGRSDIGKAQEHVFEEEEW